MIMLNKGFNSTETKQALKPIDLKLDFSTITTREEFKSLISNTFSGMELK